MYIQGQHYENITCPKCKARHPEFLNCAVAESCAKFANHMPDQSMPIVYNPWVAGVLSLFTATANQCRGGEKPAWGYNPWTGEPRYHDDIKADPYGFWCNTTPGVREGTLATDTEGRTCGNCAQHQTCEMYDLIRGACSAWKPTVSIVDRSGCDGPAQVQARIVRQQNAINIAVDALKYYQEDGGKVAQAALEEMGKLLAEDEL